MSSPSFQQHTPDAEVLATGLRFPEGPVALPDGSVVLVEIARGTVTRVTPDGTVSVAAEPGGGPNGAALGPDGALYIANNGGSFGYLELGDLLITDMHTPESWEGGAIQRVDLATGSVEELYTECDGRRLRSPNDLVFDVHGGLYFTDFGARFEHHLDWGAVYYAAADGSAITRVANELTTPNGIGLSPDGSRLYVAETTPGRVWWWDVVAPGQIEGGNFAMGHRGNLLRGFADLRFFDSLAVDAEGWVCVATILAGGITAISPDGQRVEHHALDDSLVTNICFGGDDLRTAYATLSSTGRLISFPWPRAGLALAH
jgi:gluconolactonase